MVDNGRCPSPDAVQEAGLHLLCERRVLRERGMFGRNVGAAAGKVASPASEVTTAPRNWARADTTGRGSAFNRVNDRRRVTVALHPAITPDAGEADRARPRLKARLTQGAHEVCRWAGNTMVWMYEGNDIRSEEWKEIEW